MRDFSRLRQLRNDNYYRHREFRAAERGDLRSALAYVSLAMTGKVYLSSSGFPG